MQQNLLNLSPLLKDSSPAEPEEVVLSVSELAGGLRRLVETTYDDVWVEGEISGFKRHGASGHCYFTLKDADAQLRCVMWRTYAAGCFFEPKDGMLVRGRAKASVYEQRGDLQLIIRAMKLAGEGALQKAFDAMKRKLEAEGLFDPAHKQKIPIYPEVIGLITSGDGAAVRDLISIIGRRYPTVLVVVCPVRVQGMGSAEAIAAAIEAFDALPSGHELRPDTLIVARGGGSIEDLWAFNEEAVARALYACSIPTISAVGHETDFTIADFVADVRAATPSMAAELATPDRVELNVQLQGIISYMEDAVLRRIEAHRRTVRSITQSHKFNMPVVRLRQEIERIKNLEQRLHRAARYAISTQRTALCSLQERVLLLNPLLPLERGYVRVELEGRRIRRAEDVTPGDVVALRFQDGKREATINH